RQAKPPAPPSSMAATKAPPERRRQAKMPAPHSEKHSSRAATNCPPPVKSMQSQHEMADSSRPWKNLRKCNTHCKHVTCPGGVRLFHWTVRYPGHFNASE